MVKIMGWYDNEWGYSCRTADLCRPDARQGHLTRLAVRIHRGEISDPE